MVRVRRKSDNGFVTLNNDVVKNVNLTWKARGVFTYLWSLPDDWDFYVSELVNHAPEGRDALQNALSELESFGYLKRTQARKSGTFDGKVWELTDISRFSPQTGFPLTDKPLTDNPPLLSKDSTKEKQNKENRSPKGDQLKADFEKLWSMYPRKKGKQAAYKSYVKAIKQGTTNRQIQDGIQALIKEAKTNGTKPQFLPHGSTWFNQQSWLDEYDTTTEPRVLDQGESDAAKRAAQFLNGGDND